jgi:hypothetical protein
MKLRDNIIFSLRNSWVGMGFQNLWMIWLTFCFNHLLEFMFKSFILILCHYILGEVIRVDDVVWWFYRLVGGAAELREYVGKYLHCCLRLCFVVLIWNDAKMWYFETGVALSPFEFSIRAQDIKVIHFLPAELAFIEYSSLHSSDLINTSSSKSNIIPSLLKVFIIKCFNC